MRHIQATLGRHIAASIFIEHHDAIVQIIVYRVNFAMRRIKYYSGDIPDLRFRTKDLAERGSNRSGFISAGTIVNQNTLAILVAHGHAIICGIQRNPVEGWIWIADHPDW